jgi:hypothetical protein
MFDRSSHPTIPEEGLVKRLYGPINGHTSILWKGVYL